ncbi:hypothetical protein K1719_039053 [Acacia pycnantha]|nr:hypothetical protein K1719_039053 [Acacia pycnantha]
MDNLDGKFHESVKWETVTDKSNKTCPTMQNAASQRYIKCPRCISLSKQCSKRLNLYDIWSLAHKTAKKPNWDLRRDVQKKLDKLERRTQKALSKLMDSTQRDTRTHKFEKSLLSSSFKLIKLLLHIST